MARRLNFLVYEPALWDVKMPGLHKSTELANVLADEPVLLDFTQRVILFVFLGALAPSVSFLPTLATTVVSFSFGSCIFLLLLAFLPTYVFKNE